MSTKAKLDAVAPRAPQALAVSDKVRDDSGFTGDASDILIPKLLLGQSTSKAVQDEKVPFGMIYRSTTLEVVGGKDKPVAVIPLSHTKTWVLSEKVGGKFEFRRVEPFTAENRDLPWTFTEAKEGRQQTEWKREASLNFFVLLPADIVRDLEAREMIAKTGELPDTEASLLPCALMFKSTSYKTGKTLVTHFAKAADFTVKPHVTTFNLATEKVSNDQGTFYVLKLEKLGPTEKRFLDTCDKWRNIVGKQNVKIDDSDLQRSEDVESVVKRADGTVDF